MTKKIAIKKLTDFRNFLLEKEERFKHLLPGETTEDITQNLRIKMSEVMKDYADTMDDIIKELK